MYRLRFSIVSACLVFVASTHAAEVCAPAIVDTDDVVTVTGRLMREQHFGPPGYGENPETDPPWVGVFFIPDVPFAATIPNPLAPLEPVGPEEHVTVDRLQLAYDDGQLAPGPDGSHVEITEALFSSFSGYHQSRVLMDVSAFRETPDIAAAVCTQN